MLIALGLRDVIICDSGGALSPDRLNTLPEYKIDLLEITNKGDVRGGLSEAVKGRDLFIGVSGPRLLTEDMVASMNERPIIFAMANPEPEITPFLAKTAGAAVIGTGRSDFPNQINNVLVFPGVFKGALAARAKAITEGMKIAAAKALAEVVKPCELNPEYILPDAFNESVADAVAGAVARAWEREACRRL
jgi:malate dehydrogenase (oxaloacetate-decarboxylating)